MFPPLLLDIVRNSVLVLPLLTTGLLLLVLPLLPLSFGITHL